MWPALIFAASRNDKVIGRTVTLVVSINTRNGLSQSGAPSGSRCAIDFIIDLENVDRIIDSHKGKPKINVKIKWLDVLKKYGINPIKLIITMEKNRVDTVCLRPLRCVMYVRDSCAKINNIIGAENEFLREVDIQKVNCVIIINNMFIIINNLRDGLMELNLIGSNEEKISDIIQNMDCSIPFITLKVISLFNLMFYILRRLSQVYEDKGFKI